MIVPANAYAKEPNQRNQMVPLKLIALDAEDLAVLSAHLQDAVVRVGDMAYLPRETRFVAVVNRYDWVGEGEIRRGKDEQTGERRRTGIRFERVTSAQILGISLKQKDDYLSLLAMTFEALGGDDPGGSVRLDFAGGGAIKLTVECIEAELKDLGAAWRAKRVPDHSEEE